MSRYLILTLAALLFTGCATSKSGKSQDVNKYTSRVYQSNISQYSSKIKCPASDKSYVQQNWKMLIDVANACVKEKKWKRVEKIANHMAKSTQYSPWGAYYLSIATHVKGNYEKSVWMINLAIKKAPGVGLFYYQKARIHWDLKEYSDAVVSLEKASSLDSNLIDSHRFLGQIYLRDHNYSKAVKYFEQSLEVNSRDYTALVGMAEAHLAMQNIEESLTQFNAVIGHYPKNLKVRLRTAHVYENYQKNPEMALESYKKISHLMKSRIIKGKLEFDINMKIKNLEAIVKESQPGKKVSKRNLANKEG